MPSVSRRVLTRLLGGLFAVVMLASVSVACQVPVFRYALERWSPDEYELLVLHDRELTTSEQTSIDAMKTQAKAASNFSVKAIRVDQTKESGIAQLWKQQEPGSGPVVAALFPTTAAEVPSRLIGTLPLTADKAATIVDSPVRKKVAKRLLSGQSAVWIFVPSGDQTLDDVAEKTLKAEVQRNQDALELPEQDDAEGEDALLAEVDIELRLEFSVVTLRRDDPAEAFLLQTLLASESDLADLKQPMAFPVFGRGRVLYALVGKGIMEETIGEASRFMIGPCSCQVKDQNPGFDLLMTCDWDKQVGTSKLSDAIPENRNPPRPLAIPPGR